MENQKFHKVELLLTERELRILSTMTTDYIKHFTMNQQTEFDKTALVVSHILSHQVGQAMGFLGNPKRHAEAAEREEQFAQQ